MAIEPNVVSERIPDSTELAIDRTFLAHERTLMAWVRTAISLISFGFTIYKFFYHDWYRVSHASVCVAATLGGQEELRAKFPEVPRSLAMVLAILISGLGVMAFLAALFRQ